MRDYLDFVSKNVGVRVSIVGIGKERDETIDLRSDNLRSDIKTKW